MKNHIKNIEKNGNSYTHPLDKGLILWYNFTTINGER